MADKQLVVNLALKSSGFDKQIKSINSETKLLESNFKKAGAGVKDFEKTTEGQNAKLKLLQGTYDNVKKKLEIYNDKLKKATDTLQKATEGYTKAENKVNSLKEKLAQAEKEFGKNSNEVKKLKEELKQAEKAFESKKNAVVNANNSLNTINTTINKTETEAKELETQIKDLNDALDSIDEVEGLDNLSNDMQNASNQATDFSAKMTIVGQGLQNVGGKALDTGKQILGGLGALAKAGGEWEISLNAISTMLEDSEQQVRQWASENAKALGLTENQLTFLVAKNTMLAEKMGKSGQAATEFAKSMSTATLDLATFYDVPAEEMQSKFNSALNGSVEIMDQYGVDIAVASLQQTSYFKSLKKTWAQLTEAEKKQVRYNKILEDTQKVTGNAAKEADSYSVQSQLLGQQIKEIVGTLGQQLIPVLQPLVEKVAQVAQAFGNWVKENPELARVLLVVAGAIGAILTVIGAIIVPIGVLTVAMAGLSAVSLPVVGAIAAVIAVIVALIAIIGVVIAKWDEIKQCWSNFCSWANTLWENFRQSFSKKWEEIKTNAIQFGKDLVNAIKESWTSFINWLESWADRLANLINSTWQSIKETACRWGDNLVEGVKFAFSTLFDIITSPFRRAWSFISSIGEKIGGLISKINPFNWFSLDSVLEVPVSYSGLDNVALSGSYYNANTRASNNLSDFIKLSNNIPTKSSVSNVNSTDINTRLLGNQIASAILQSLSGIKLDAEINTEINGRQIASAVTGSVIKNVDSQIKSRNWR